MKNAKKLLLLVLSLVMLVSIFAVVAFAEDAPATATVVYPDGSTDSVAVGSVIVPKEFTTETSEKNENGTVSARVFYGANNTLYIDDATEGWSFAVEGAEAALEDLTVTEEMAGKKIIASGVDKVYSTIDVTFSNVDYYKWISGSTGTTVDGSAKSNAVFVKAGTSGTDVEFTVYASGKQTTVKHTYSAVKRVAGTYKLYFTDPAKLGKFFTTSEKTEVGGVMLDYQDFRTGGTTGSKLSVKLYADQTVGNIFCWGLNGYDRPNTSDVTGKSAQASGGTAPIVFDMNSYNVTVTSTSRLELRAMPLTIYSSKPGAHWYHLNAVEAFYASDDGYLRIGNDVSGGEYADNLYVHCQKLFQGHYGSGASIYGGHYYQTKEGVDYFVRISRRVYEISNASFYVKGGTALFGDPTKHDGGGVVSGSSIVKNCNFYSDGNSPILTGALNASLKFQSCNFYGVSYTEDPETKDRTLVIDAAAGTVTFVAATDKIPANTVNDAISYSTVTWLDGTTDYYYAATQAAAKNFIEGCEKAIAIAPHEILSDDGKTLHCIFDHKIVFVYDEKLNATMTDAGEQVKVYFAVYVTGGDAKYYTDAQTAGKDFKAYMLLMDATGAKVVLYDNITTAGFGVLGASKPNYELDINGHTLTVTSAYSSGFALDICQNHFSIYSSKAGGVIDTSNVTAFFRTNDSKYNGARIDGTVVIGERFTAATGDNSFSNLYRGNLTVHCRAVNHDMYGGSAYLIGVDFVQSKSSTATYFLVLSRVATNNSNVQTIRDCSFVTCKSATAPMLYRSSSARTFTNCSFIYTGEGVATLVATSLGKHTSSSKANTISLMQNAIFSGCNFYNVLPVASVSAEYKHTNTTTSAVFEGVNTATLSYNNCSFGFADSVPSRDLNPAEDAVMYLVYTANPIEKTILGATYTMNTMLYTDVSGVLRINWGSAAEFDFWEIGTKPYRAAENVTKFENGVYYTNSAFNLDGIAQLDENGIVTESGEVSVEVAFANSEVIMFTYFNPAANLLYMVGISECPDAAAAGERFYELFNAPDVAYEIVLYQDMILSKAVPFGELTTGDQPQYNSLALGNITLDLGGRTLTIAENATAINLSNSNNVDLLPSGAVFGLEGSSNKTFTLKSSVPNGKILNLSPYAVVGVGERDGQKVVIEGDNLTIDSVGTIVGNVETSGFTLTVTGGTYIYRGGNIAVVATGTVNISDATFILTNAGADALFALPNHMHATTQYTVTGIEVYAQGANLFGFANNSHYAEISSLSNPDAKTIHLSFSDCVLAGIAFVAEKEGIDGIAYAGDMKVASADLLALSIPEAPEGTVPAYYFITFGENTYKVAAYLTANQAALVNWGFGITEYWKLGETATHDNTLIDGVFTYAFRPFVVNAENNVTEYALVGIASGAMQMNLTLQGQIGVNLLIMPGYLNGATVSVAGKDVAMATKEDVRIASVAISPKEEAVASVTFIITMGENAHKVTVGIGAYAAAVLNSNMSALAKNLTYAMVQYVRAMNPEAKFLEGVELTDGYEYQTLTAEKYESNNTLLSAIRFNLSETIEIQVLGKSVADGTDVHLILATTRGEHIPMAGNSATFKDLYVNEFYGDMQINVGKETYEYSLANYYAEMTDDYYKAVIEALYNYAYHAQEYVDSITPAAN